MHESHYEVKGTYQYKSSHIPLPLVHVTHFQLFLLQIHNHSKMDIHCHCSPCYVDYTLMMHCNYCQITTTEWRHIQC